MWVMRVSGLSGLNVLVRTPGLELLGLNVWQLVARNVQPPGLTFALRQRVKAVQP